MACIDDELQLRRESLAPLRPKTVVMDLDGLSVNEFRLALNALEQSAEVRDKRIDFCSVRNPGDAILIETGWQHGGCFGAGEWVLLIKDGDGWRVDGVRQWRS